MRNHSPRSLAVALFVLCCTFTWFVVASNRPTVPDKSTAAEFYFHHDHVIGTSLDLWLIAPDETAAEKAEKAMLDEIERLRRIFSTFDDQSEISRLNRTQGPLAVSTEMIEVLRQYEIWQA